MLTASAATYMHETSTKLTVRAKMRSVLQDLLPPLDRIKERSKYCQREPGDQRPLASTPALPASAACIRQLLHGASVIPRSALSSCACNAELSRDTPSGRRPRVILQAFYVLSLSNAQVQAKCRSKFLVSACGAGVPAQPPNDRNLPGYLRV